MSAIKYLDKSGLTYFWGKVKGIVSPKADKSEMSVTPGTGDNADKTTIQLKQGTSATVLTQHQDISGKMNKVNAATSGHLAKFNGSGQVVDGGDTADYAKNLVAPVVQGDAEVVYRKTGGILAVDGKGGAVLQKIKGKTLAWNQMLQSNRVHGNSYSSEGITWTVDANGVITINGTATAQSQFEIYTDSLSDGFKGITGHKYYISLVENGKGGLTSFLGRIIGNGSGLGGGEGYPSIQRCTNGSIGAGILYRVASGCTVSNEKLYPVMDDLTLLYGSEIDGMTDEQILAKFESEYPGYHDYNSGTLISNDASAIETVGFNLWDEEWEQGGRTSQGDIDTSYAGIWITNKNLIPVFPSASYYIYCSIAPTTQGFYLFYYDKEGNFLYRDVQYWGTPSTQFDVPDGCYYIAFSYRKATYDCQICINLSDPAKNGTYEPYKKTVTQLNLGSFQVRDSQGNVTTITGGLKSAGDVYDEIVGNKYIQRVGSVNLGALNWAYDNSYQIFYFMFVGSLPINPTNMTLGAKTGDLVINSKYALSELTINHTDSDFSSGPDKTLAIQRNGFTSFSNAWFQVKDTSYTDAATFKTAMSGVRLYYQLATPIEYELVTVPDYTYPVDGDGTERRLPEDTASSIHAPFRADILYALNGSATLRNLDANYVRNDNIKQDTGNNENTVMSQAAVTRELNIVNQRISDLGSVTDLSFIDPKTGVGMFTRNTAKTYVVRTAGNYKFPLVYSNAIRNGKPNPASYTRIVSDYTAEFVNHLGNTITSPYIEQNIGCIPASVSLLWQTANGLITSVSLENGPDCHYLRFTVASVPSDNGLACLVVKDANGDIMWSWDIWLTTDDLSPEEYTNYTGVKYYMMPEALGTIWSDRTNKLGYNLLFQWGRKDAVGLPAAYNSNTAHALYDINGNSVTLDTYGVADDADAGGTVRSVSNSIKMPDKFFLEYDNTNHNWNNLPWFNNFWNAAITSSGDLADNQATAIKTIYDPSPVGYMLPAGRFATGFTTTGTGSSTASEFNVVGSFSNGWNFKKNSADAVGAYWPASGRQDGALGSLYRVCEFGYFWSFAPYSQTYARYLSFGDNGVYPLDDSYRANGFSVRPSVELT